MPLRPVPPAAPEPQPAADHMLVEHRLAALERLSQLLERGVLSPDEFAAEKALVLRLPVDELVLHENAAAAPEPHPSLLGRLFGWRLIAAGLAAGLALSAYSSPEALGDLSRYLR